MHSSNSAVHCLNGFSQSCQIMRQACSAYRAFSIYSIYFSSIPGASGSHSSMHYFHSSRNLPISFSGLNAHSISQNRSAPEPSKPFHFSSKAYYSAPIIACVFFPVLFLYYYINYYYYSY